jgi:hypothetical protein
MPVLGTKLHLPSPRRRLVQRARLIDQLHVNTRRAAVRRAGDLGLLRA